MGDEHGKRHDDSSYGKRFDDHTVKQMLRSWPVIVSIVTACWILYGKLDGKFSSIDEKITALSTHQAVEDDKIDNIQENVKLLIKR